jgi:hypothetical protein
MDRADQLMPSYSHRKMPVKLAKEFILFLLHIGALKAMSRDKNPGRSQSIKTDSSSFQMVEEFRYLGTTLTNPNSMQEQNKSRMKSGNYFYNPVQNLLAFSLPSKNLNIKIRRPIIWGVFCRGVQLGRSH